MRTVAVLAAVAAAAASAWPRAAAADRPVFDLVDNRLLAHIVRGGGVVAVTGSAGFAKYLNGGRPNLPWKLGQKLDGRLVALSDNYSRVTLPLSEDQAPAARTLRLRVSLPRPRELEVKVNGQRAGQVPVVAGWQTVEVPLPDGAPAGEVEIQLAWSKRGAGGSPAVEWIQLGGDANGDAAPAFYDGAARALLLPSGGGLAYYVQVPEGGKLTGSVSGPSCEVAVRARAAGGKPLDGALRGVGASIDLAPLAGQVVRLDLTGRGCPEARLTAAALTVPGAVPTVQRGKPPRNVVFWIMDSLRADKLRPFSPGARAEVPVLERLASLSTIFLSAYVQGNESRVSHASLWSALFPSVHRMIAPKTVLDGKWLTIGEVAKKAGLYTSGVTSNGWITARWGFGDGWDAYRNHIHDGGGTKAEFLWSRAQRSLKDRGQKPFFLYLGTVDTHVSWRAHEPWISRYDPEPYNGPFKKWASDPDVDKIVSGKLKITERDKTRIVALYDSAISYQDDILGKLLVQLEAWGAARDTMIIITADHGEEFWEDGRLGHGGSLLETLLRVPLLIYYPPLFPPGTVVKEGVDTVDVLPTIAEALGVPPSPDWQGESLIPLAQGVGRGYPRPSFASQYEHAHAMRLGRWKAVLRSGGGLRVYDLEKDPQEKTDVAATRPLERRFVTDALSTFLHHQRSWKKSRWGVASNHSARFADEVELRP
jgi:arylsulfatase A-like enzyme